MLDSSASKKDGTQRKAGTTHRKSTILSRPDPYSSMRPTSSPVSRERQKGLCLRARVFRELLTRNTTSPGALHKTFLTKSMASCVRLGTVPSSLRTAPGYSDKTYSFVTMPSPEGMQSSVCGVIIPSTRVFISPGSVVPMTFISD